MPSEVTQELDRLLSTLEPAVSGQGSPVPKLKVEASVGDAIDEELASAARTTSVVSLREAKEIAAFRDELADGLIRVDTANQLLRLINEVVSRLLV